MITKQDGLRDLSDAVLVERAQARDQEAFGEIVERYQSLLCSVAYSRCGDLALSEDRAQEAFLQAWSKLPNLREVGKLKAWLCTIVRNQTSRDFERQQHSVMRHASPLEFADDLEADSLSPTERVVLDEEQSLVWAALEEVPETYREPLILFYREEQSIARVADALDLSHDAVKQRLSRGRKMLQESLAATVETTLANSKPSKKFTASVLGGVSMLISKPATAAGVTVAAAKTAVGTVAKTTLAAGAVTGFGLTILSLLGILPVLLWMMKESDASMSQFSEEEHEVLDQMSFRKTHFQVFQLILFFGGIYLTMWLVSDMESKWIGYCFLLLVLVLAQLPWAISDWRLLKSMRQNRIAAGTYVSPPPLVDSDDQFVVIRETISRIVLSGYLITAWPVLLAVRAGDWTGAFILLMGSTSISLIAAFIAIRIPKYSLQCCVLSYSAIALFGLAVVSWFRSAWTPGLEGFGWNFMAMIGIGMTTCVLSMINARKMQGSI